MEKHDTQAGRRQAQLDYAVWPGWRLLMQDAGLEAAPILRRAQLPGDLFARQNVRLDAASFFKLWCAIEQEAACLDPGLPAPLRIAHVMSSDWFDPELFAALCSANMGEALQRIATYVKLIAPMRFTIARGQHSTTVSIDFLNSAQPTPGVFVVFKLVFLLQLVRLATRSPVQALQVSWPVQPGEAAPSQLYSDYFGCAVGNTALATLVFANADMDRPFLTANHKMWLFFEPSLRQRLADLDRSASMVERVRSTLLESLPAGQVSMQAVCHKLAVSARTLQRRLQDEGTTFQQTLDSVRDALARHYLGHTDMSSAEISFLLGYEDANSFARAFQAWSGKTPQTVRGENSVQAQLAAG